MESRQRDPSAYTAVRAQIDPAAAALIELVEDEPAYAPARAAYLAQLQQFPTPPWT